MKKLILLCVLLLIPACAPFKQGFEVLTTTIQNPVKDKQLYQAELVFDGSVKTFNALKDLCARRVLPPVCRTYVNQGRAVIGKAYAADIAAQRFIARNPTLNAAKVVSAFTNLVDDFNSTVTRLGALK